MVTVSNDEAAEEEYCTLRLYFRLGSAALCWYITPAELFLWCKTQDTAEFFLEAHLCAEKVRKWMWNQMKPALPGGV